ncbi:unnamed protein product [Sphagnum troendelagicum]|uniref:Aminotransferase class I/classII large domain-containing protein n=1 Tax=Sphagnum troendelagicum TaxID=128251 RepID=A0ABP0UL65_9BRYO
MRIIVPLQGLLQGRSGLALGVILPLLSFYFIQLRPKQQQQQQQKKKKKNSSRRSTLGDSQLLPLPVELAAAANSRSENSEQQQDPQKHSSEATASEIHNNDFSQPKNLKETIISERALWVSKTFNSASSLVASNAYDPLQNPRGCIELGVSLNKLCLDLIQDWLSTHISNAPGHATFPNLEEAANCEGMHDYGPMRTVLANFMGIVMGGRLTFDPTGVIITAGAGAAIEMLVFCLAQPGEAILIPSPYYHGFDKDIKWRTRVEILPVPCFAHNNFRITRNDLEIAYCSALERGLTVRAVLLSNPSNPVGDVLDRATLQSIISFVHDKNIHLISDEVYAGCVFEESDFVSVAEILDSFAEASWDRSRVHIIYGISKDLGLVGFRVGVVYSWNVQLIAAASKLTRFSPTSTHTQGLLIALLSDKIFVTNFLAENRRRVTQRYQKVVTALDQIGIVFARASGGIFCWMHLGHCMRSSSQEEETKLHKYLLHDIGVHLTPGYTCSCPEPGWFRICYAAVDDQTLTIALDRLQKLGQGVQY